MNLNLYKSKVEKWLEQYFVNKPQENQRFFEPMKYSLKVGGKRIRPILMICTFNMYSSNEELVLPFAGAMEMIHTYSLIHDDLPCMDDDDLRRGKPTNHKVYGEAIATLAGDGLLNEAMIIMLNQCISGDIIKIKASSIIANSAGAEGMIKGQFIDIESEGKKIDEKTLLNMHENKTGQLIKASILAGAILGKANEKDVDILSQFGEKLGLAFQIKDDILDIEGNAELLGKTQSDKDNEKTTFITMYGLERCKIICKDLTTQCYELLNKLTKDTEELKSITEFLLEREY
jgi:geranylgeranyl diphosphate synthase, type II